MRRPGSVDLMLGATIVIWAFNITVTRYVLTHGFQPLAYGAIRYGAAALLAVASTVALERSLRVGGRRSLALIAAASLFLLVNQFSFVYALKLGSATTVALILGMTPIFAAIMSSVVGLEQLSGRFWIATAIGCAGVALVALGAGGDLSADLGGDLLAIVLAMSWAAYSVTIAPLMRRYSPYRISAVVLLVMCIPFVAASSPQIASQDYASLGWLVWVGLAFAIVGPLFLTNLLWFTAIHRVGPSRATLFANVQPFVAAIFAALILSERLHWLQIVGGVTILAGIVLERRWRRAQAAALSPQTRSSQVRPRAGSSTLVRVPDEGAEPAALVDVDPVEGDLDEVGGLAADDGRRREEAAIGKREADVEADVRRADPR
jgi:drug/metabolite transporter (DMT)-like permease